MVMRAWFGILLGLSLGCGSASHGASNDASESVSVGAGGDGAGGIASPGGTEEPPGGHAGEPVAANGGEPGQVASSGTGGQAGPAVVGSEAGRPGESIGGAPSYPEPTEAGAGGEPASVVGSGGAGGCGGADPGDEPEHDPCASCGTDDLCAYDSLGKRYCLYVGVGSCTVEPPSASDAGNCGTYCAAQRKGCEVAYVSCGVNPLIGADGKECPVCAMGGKTVRNCGPGQP